MSRSLILLAIALLVADAYLVLGRRPAAPPLAGAVIVRIHDVPSQGEPINWRFAMWRGDTIDVYATPLAQNKVRFNIYFGAPQHEQGAHYMGTSWVDSLR